MLTFAAGEEGVEGSGVWEETGELSASKGLKLEIKVYVYMPVLKFFQKSGLSLPLIKAYFF